jgi:cytochrome c553
MSSLVPTLHGQPAEYLAMSLRAYAAGQRKSGIMQPIAAELEQEEIAKVAAYYAGLSQPRRDEMAGSDPANAEAGRALATRGVPEAGVPPCLGCHGRQALPTYPRLAGQQADYMIGQLQVWKRGLNTFTEHAAIMAPIAQRLSQEQIKAVSAYFASLDPATVGEAQQ